MFKLASLFVDIKADQSPVDRALSGIRSQLGATNVAVGTFVGNLAAGFARAAASFAGTAFEKTIASASTLNETLSKVGTVFGPAAAKVTDQADRLAETFGLPKQAMLDANAVLGLFGKGAGQSSEQAADFSNKMVKLAADAMSFYNVPFDQALQKIQSGLSGESEPLRAFGVFLNEDAVAAEAVALGLSKTGKELDDGTKVMARASLITKGLANANGDLERTFDGTENQSRKFWGTLDNLAQSIGTELLPIFNQLLAVGTSVASGLTAAWQANRETFRGWAASVLEAGETAAVMWRNMGEVWEIVQIKAREMTLNTIAVLGALAENGVRLAGWFGSNWYHLIRDGVVASFTVFSNFTDNLANLSMAIKAWFEHPTQGFKFEWKPLLDGFQATTSALPEMIRPALVDLQSEIDAVGDRMARKESARLDGIKAKAQATAQQAESVGKTTATKAEKFKSEVMDSADYSRKLLTGILGADDTPKKQLAAAEKTAVSTAQLAEDWKNWMAYNASLRATLG